MLRAYPEARPARPADRRQQQFIQSLVESGRYQNASEVIREGLRLIEQREAEEAARLERLRAAVEVGLTDLERGKFNEFGEATALERHLNSIGDDILGRARSH